MYRGHSVAVVLPAYNEEGFVGDVMTSLPGFVDRIYVVDDASTDGTWGEVTEHAESLNAAATDALDEGWRRVVPVQHAENRGAGGALKTGYRRALADGLDLVATMDADGQMDPAFLPDLLDPLVEGRADYAKGDRLSRGDHDSMPRFRLFGNAVLTLLTRVASGYWRTSDPQNGYTAITHEALAAVDVHELFEYYGYCNELLVRLNATGMRVADVPMPARYGEEESDIEYATYIPKVSGMLFRSFLWRLRTKYLDDGVHPVLLSYSSGALAGIATVAWLLVLGEPYLPLLVVAVAALLAAVGLERAESRALEVTVE